MKLILAIQNINENLGTKSKGAYVHMIKQLS